jgi:hypothetical protein
MGPWPCSVSAAWSAEISPEHPQYYILIWDIRARLAIIRAALKDSNYRRQYRAFLGRLRTARAEAGLTQVDVSRKLSRPQSFVSKCESGERRVDVVELQQFARLYRKQIEFFLD